MNLPAVRMTHFKNAKCKLCKLLFAMCIHTDVGKQNSCGFNMKEARAAQ
jgi:hypothetical protein